MKNLVWLALFTQGIVSLSFAQTIIPPGNVYGTWGINGSPYYVQGDITIPNDSTLIIEPGVEIEFQGYFALNVQGRILALGSDSDEIWFTINDTTGFHNPDTALGGWNGIQFIDTPTDNDTSKLDYCIITYGKAVGSSPPENSGGAIFISNFDKVVISNCIVSNNSSGGFDSPTGGGLSIHFADITLNNNLISANKAWDGGGIQIWESNLNFSNNSIVFNSADEGGGGIWIGGLSDIVFNDDDISNNTAGGNGGGMVCWQSTKITLNSVDVTSNTANWGGGIGVINAEVQLNDCILNNNGAVGLGGGIGSDFGDVYINNTSFSNDTSGFLGGAVHSWHCDIQVKHSLFQNNSSDLGGSIYAENSEVRIDTSRFLNSSAQFGGALNIYNSSLQIDSCYFEGNEAVNDGGAFDYKADSLMFSVPYPIKIFNSSFINNTALNAAGGFSIQQTHTESSLINLEIDRCRISNNFAHHVSGFRIIRCVNEVVVSNSIISGNIAEAWVGGGNIISNSVGKVFNCLFFDNHAGTVSTNASTGGLGISSSSKVDVINCTFVNNSSGMGGGLQVYRGGDANVINSIFWNNSPNQFALNAVLDTLPCLLTLSYNDIQFGIDSVHVIDSVSVVNWGIGNIDAYPLFVDTLNNNLHLQDMSPCISTGIDSIEIAGFWHYAPLTDIEGNPRPNPVGTMPDMGAYESDYPVGLDDNNTSIPKEHFLFQNYPNPFNPNTSIKWLIPETEIVTLKIFDALGKEVSTLVNEELNSGAYEMVFNASRLSSGIYFYQLKAESFVETMKMILLK